MKDNEVILVGILVIIIQTTLLNFWLERITRKIDRVIEQQIELETKNGK